MKFRLRGWVCEYLSAPTAAAYFGCVPISACVLAMSFGFLFEAAVELYLERWVEGVVAVVMAVSGFACGVCVSSSEFLFPVSFFLLVSVAFIGIVRVAFCIIWTIICIFGGRYFPEEMEVWFDLYALNTFGERFQAALGLYYDPVGSTITIILISAATIVLYYQALEISRSFACVIATYGNGWENEGTDSLKYVKLVNNDCHYIRLIRLLESSSLPTQGPYTSMDVCTGKDQHTIDVGSQINTKGYDAYESDNNVHTRLLPIIATTAHAAPVPHGSHNAPLVPSIKNATYDSNSSSMHPGHMNEFAIAALSTASTAATASSHHQQQPPDAFCVVAAKSFLRENSSAINQHLQLQVDTASCGSSLYELSCGAASSLEDLEAVSFTAPGCSSPSGEEAGFDTEAAITAGVSDMLLRRREHKPPPTSTSGSPSTTGHNSFESTGGIQRGQTNFAKLQSQHFMEGLLDGDAERHDACSYGTAGGSPRRAAGDALWRAPDTFQTAKVDTTRYIADRHDDSARCSSALSSSRDGSSRLHSHQQQSRGGAKYVDNFGNSLTARSTQTLSSSTDTYRHGLGGGGEDDCGVPPLRSPPSTVVARYPAPAPTRQQSSAAGMGMWQQSGAVSFAVGSTASLQGQQLRTLESVDTARLNYSHSVDVRHADGDKRYQRTASGRRKLQSRRVG